MQKGNVDLATLKTARERLEAKRVELVQTMAKSKTVVADRLRLFLYVEGTIEKLKVLESRQQDMPVATQGMTEFQRGTAT
jgi:hypothetical protein